MSEQTLTPPYCDRMCHLLADKAKDFANEVKGMAETDPRKKACIEHQMKYDMELQKHFAAVLEAKKAILTFSANTIVEVTRFKLATGGHAAPPHLSGQMKALALKLGETEAKGHTALMQFQKKMVQATEPSGCPVEALEEDPTADANEHLCPCNKACIQICNDYNAFEARVLALPDDNPQKQDHIEWCAAFETKFKKHLMETKEYARSVFKFKDEAGDLYAEHRSRRYYRTKEEADRMSAEAKTLMVETERMEKKVHNMVAEDGEVHNRLRAELEAKRKLRL